MFGFHHTSISVTDVDRSQDFYGKFGFREVHRWISDDGTLQIRHLSLNGYLLELFAYEDPRDDPDTRAGVGGNLDEVGVKHFALSVPLLEDAWDALSEAGIVAEADPQMGRTGIRFFFVRDPDGIWVEIVEDHRFD